MTLERQKKFRDKLEIPPHIISRILRAIHASEVKDKIGTRTPVLKLPFGTTKVVLVHLKWQQRR